MLTTKNGKPKLPPLLLPIKQIQSMEIPQQPEISGLPLEQVTIIDMYIEKLQDYKIYLLSKG